MSYELAHQTSVLPPGYRLQLIWKDGIPETVPVGTSRHGQLELQYGALLIRERIAKELLALFVREFGYDYHDVMVLCANDPDGNEGVWVRAKCKPKNNWHEQLKTEEPKLQIEKGNSDVIDI